MRTFIALLVVFITSCSDTSIPTPVPSARVTVYHEIGTSRLTQEFSDELTELFASEGRPVSETGTTITGKPRGDITLPNRQSFDLYGNFVVSGSRYWQSPILEEFWIHLKQHGELGALDFKPDPDFQPAFNEPTQMPR